MSLPVRDAPAVAPYDPSFQNLRELLASGAGLAEIEAEVRRLCLIALAVGTERAIAYVMHMDKSDESLETD